MIQSSRKAIQYGVSLAWKHDAPLYGIPCVYNPFCLRGWSMGSLSLEKKYGQILLAAGRKLAALVDSEKAKGMAIQELIREGEPTEEVSACLFQKLLSGYHFEKRIDIF